MSQYADYKCTIQASPQVQPSLSILMDSMKKEISDLTEAVFALNDRVSLCLGVSTQPPMPMDNEKAPPSPHSALVLKAGEIIRSLEELTKNLRDTHSRVQL